jgi:hypothetical protein
MPHVYAIPVSVSVLLVGLPKKKTAKLRHLIFQSYILNTVGDALTSCCMQLQGVFEKEFGLFLALPTKARILCLDSL